MSALRFLCLVSCLSGAYAQSMFFGPTAQIQHHHVTSEIRYRLATTKFTTKVSYVGEIPTVFPYDVIIPAGAFISNFSIEVSGSYYTGSVQERQEEVPNRMRERFPGSRRPPKPRNTNLYTINVHLPPISNATVYVTYQEVLERRLGRYRHDIYMSPRYKPMNMECVVTILESRFLSNVRGTSTIDSESIQVVRMMPNTAQIRYLPTAGEREQLYSDRIANLLSVQYDVARDRAAGEILAYNGYFTYYLSPTIETYEPKDILFILDTSSSMRVQKMDQLKNAMATILKDLRPQDRFNIMEFNTMTKFWQEDQLRNGDQESIDEAIEHVNSIFPSGATNVNDALVRSLEFMNEISITDRAIIIFLTDGRASTGVTETTVILNNVLTKNIFKIPIYTLAFGVAADWSFVRSVAIQNNGKPRKIYESMDAPEQIVNFYNEISKTVLTNVTVDFMRRVADPSTVTKSSFRTINDGAEIVITGKLGRRNRKWFPLLVKGKSGGKEVSFKMRANMEEVVPQMYEGFEWTLTSMDKVTETTWAFITIRQMIQEYESEMNAAIKAVLRQRLVEFAVKYNLVTVVTSMLVPRPDQPDEDEEMPLGDQAFPEPLALERGGFSSTGGRDPHFMIKTVWLDDQLCFDVAGEHIYQIIHDPVKNMSINIKLNHGHVPDGHGGKRTYITATGVVLPKFYLRAYLDGVVINNKKHEWGSNFKLETPDVKVTSRQHEMSVMIELPSGFRFVIYKHVPAGEGDQFLNIELDREGKLSKNTTGLLGQFIHQRIWMKQPHQNLSQEFVRLESGGSSHCLASLRIRTDPVTRTLYRCWLLHPGKGIFKVPQNRFLVKSIKSSGRSK